MADVMETIKDLLGDENKLNDMVSSIADGKQSGGFDMDYINQMKDIINKMGNSRNDPRANLLMSLRPYMRPGRQSSIDNAVKLLTVIKIANLMK